MRHFARTGGAGVHLIMAIIHERATALGQPYPKQTKDFAGTLPGGGMLSRPA